MCAETVWVEVRAGFEGGDRVDFGAEGGDAEVVAPDLAGWASGEEGCFERGFAVDAWRVAYEYL